MNELFEPKYIDGRKLWKKFDEAGLFVNREDRDIAQEVVEDMMKESEGLTKVVRCKSCKFSEWSDKNKQRYCTRKWTMYKVRERDFCSHGKKYEF